MQVCPKRVIYSRLSRGGCFRNLGGISDFALDAGNWSFQFSHIFARNTYLNVGDLHKNTESIWWLSAASQSQNKCYIFIWEIFFGSEALLRKYSQSKIKMWILVEPEWFFFFYFFFTKIGKKKKKQAKSRQKLYQVQSSLWVCLKMKHFKSGGFFCLFLQALEKGQLKSHQSLQFSTSTFQFESK